MSKISGRRGKERAEQRTPRRNARRRRLRWAERKEEAEVVAVSVVVVATVVEGGGGAGGGCELALTMRLVGDDIAESGLRVVAPSPPGAAAAAERGCILPSQREGAAFGVAPRSWSTREMRRG